MTFDLFVVGPKDRPPEGAVVVNTTSRSTDFGRAFSPFWNQGPIEVGPLTANNVENMWQYAKVYAEHLDGDSPSQAWFQWRDKGLSSPRAVRYPMGKGAKPEFSWLEDRKLSYVDAREAIYIPAFWQKLERYCQREVASLCDMLTATPVALWDFDGYLTDDSWKAIRANPERRMGHAFVVKKYVYKAMGRAF